ncbi:NADH:flavin oxidoreductase/NADH oxidase [Bradyrhizobium sp. 179]|uniref:NADH:flavin oxidoreductase/NADH oxidase n=1 Tax=unclassified Bradyrhizobium TaxID=2631580 RepID=UPI001FFA9190|nr:MULTISPECIES: NADH:flavin oxidoreductase/NADH oxidase [unclassified Bradyrhizobium]MCK1546372.1 NADH:flavin oxidoreductase/NADH oxidase [Bradyrhizobium sp. 179]UQR65425.1 NADH:flavin oxidoreductase/NADH oxidase [Bradyrhizobium sp. C-145]
MVKLFESIAFRGVELSNRIVVSPMGMYSAENGYVTPFHLVHYGKFAMGGAGLVFVEQTSVTRKGRITNGDPGLWEDGQIDGMRQIVHVIKSHGAKAAIQINHGGRKSSQQRAFRGNSHLTDRDIEMGEETWVPTGPSDVAFSEGFQTPIPLSKEGLVGVRDAFVATARRAVLAGFDVIELHMAHGYLLQSFLSPLANFRSDEYGGSLENRMRFPLEVTRAVRAALPSSTPLFVRISATDWIDGGWEIEDSVVFSRKLKELGVDLVDCSTGGNLRAGSTNANLGRGPGYQVPFAERIRHEANIATGAVGMIRTPDFAEKILQDDRADLIFMARQMLFNPFWALHAAEHFGLTGNFEKWPEQYGWWLAKWGGALRTNGESLHGVERYHEAAE